MRGKILRWLVPQGLLNKESFYQKSGRENQNPWIEIPIFFVDFILRGILHIVSAGLLWALLIGAVSVPIFTVVGNDSKHLSWPGLILLTAVVLPTFGLSYNVAKKATYPLYHAISPWKRFSS